MIIGYYFYPEAVLTFICLLLLSAVTYYRIAKTNEGLCKITSLVFYLSLSIGLARSIFVLQNMESPKHIGTAIGFSLLLLFYASILKVIVIIYSRLISGTVKL